MTFCSNVCTAKPVTKAFSHFIYLPCIFPLFPQLFNIFMHQRKTQRIPKAFGKMYSLPLAQFLPAYDVYCIFLLIYLSFVPSPYYFFSHMRLSAYLNTLPLWVQFPVHASPSVTSYLVYFHLLSPLLFAICLSICCLCIRPIAYVKPLRHEVTSFRTNFYLMSNFS